MSCGLRQYYCRSTCRAAFTGIVRKDNTIDSWMSLPLCQSLFKCFILSNHIRFYCFRCFNFFFQLILNLRLRFFSFFYYFRVYIKLQWILKFLNLQIWFLSNFQSRCFLLFEEILLGQFICIYLFLFSSWLTV